MSEKSTHIIYTGNAETGKERDGLHSLCFSNSVSESDSDVHATSPFGNYIILHH